MSSPEELLPALQGLNRSFDRLHSDGVIERGSGVRLNRALHPVLVMIDSRGPIRTGELAKLLALRSSTVSRHLTTLENEGLIRRKGELDDGRASTLELSDAGRERLGSIFHFWHKVLAEHLKDLPDQGSSLVEGIRKLTAHLDAQS